MLMSLTTVKFKPRFEMASAEVKAALDTALDHYKKHWVKHVYIGYESSTLYLTILVDSQEQLDAIRNDQEFNKAYARVREGIESAPSSLRVPITHTI